MMNNEPDTATLDENQINTVQEILNAIRDLKGVYDRADAYLRGRGIEDPQAEIEALHKAVF